MLDQNSKILRSSKSAEERLTPPQREILATGILETGFNCILQMPTGSGKTWLAEKVIEETISNGFRAVFLTPLRALAEELYSRWKTEFPKKTRIGIFTGDYGTAGKTKFPASFNQAEILIMTPERLDIITRNWRNHWRWLPEVDLLVADEIHLLGEKSRGARLEGALSRFRRLNPFARIIGLSATMGNRGELADWLGGVEYRSDWRPVPLTWSSVRYRKATDKPALLFEVVKKNLMEGGQSLVFVQSRRRAETLCRELQENGFAAGHHHAGLSHVDRNKTENEFRSGILNTLVTTSTLEMGINLPARQVILYDLQEFNGTDFNPLSVNTVWQRAGRAGRYGIDENGEVVLFTAGWDKLSGDYENGSFEPILSILNNPKMLAEQILAEVQSGLSRTEQQLKSAFTGYLASLQNRLPDIGRLIAELIKAEMLINVREISEICDSSKPEIETEKVDYRLKVTPLGKIGVRHLLYPATVILFRKILDSSMEYTFFDLLLICSVSEDSQPRLPVDFEEIDDIMENLEDVPSLLLQLPAEEVVTILGTDGKRLLSSIKMALTLRSWTREGDAQKAAGLCNCYSFEVERLTEQTARLLQAMREIINLSEISNETEGDKDFNHYSESIPTLKEKITVLHKMIETGLDEQSATLTFIDGIGVKNARLLKKIGCEDIEDLAAMDPLLLSGEKGISEKRARKWNETAVDLQKRFSAFYFRENTLPHGIKKAFDFPTEIDPYRLRRALELKVMVGDGGNFRVTGGLEPHVIRLKNNLLFCDCMDFSKGNTCKHILAVRLLRGDSALKKLADQILKPDTKQPLDLFALWMSS